MNKLNFKLLPLMLLAGALTVQSCKSKKMAAKPPVPEPVAEKTVEKEKTETAATTPAAKPDESEGSLAKANLNFSNIQFEFNSAVLKTSSYEVLDQIASEIKKAPSVKFIINGHSSAEGTPEHNQSLSVDRANSVKSYLVNAGIAADRFETVGYGESKPIAKNDTEASRALNRRVEIDKVK